MAIPSTTGISYDGDEIFVYRSDNFDGNLYFSQLQRREMVKALQN